MIFGRCVKRNKRMEKMMVDERAPVEGACKVGGKNALDLCSSNVLTNMGGMGDGGDRTERGTPAERAASM